MDCEIENDRDRLAVLTCRLELPVLQRLERHEGKRRRRKGVDDSRKRRLAVLIDDDLNDEIAADAEA